MPVPSVIPFSLSAVLPSICKIKSWALSPPLSLKESCSPGRAQEKWISPLSFSFVEAVQETIPSPHPSPLAGQRSDRHDPPPPSSYHVSLAAIFSGGEKRARQKDRQKLGTGGREGRVRPGVKESSILHLPMMSPGCDVWDMAQCWPLYLCKKSKLSYSFQPIKKVCMRTWQW